MLLKLFFIILPVFISLNINAQVPVKLRSALSAGGSSKIVMSDGHQYYLQQSIGQPGITGLSQTIIISSGRDSFSLLPVQ